MRTTKNIVKRVIDVMMTATLLCLMAYQVTGGAAHEWIGIGMTVLVILHHILNGRWYGALFKGKYNPYRIAITIINILLIISFVITAFCGMAMSGHAVPFLYGVIKVSTARMLHLSISHWSFVLMGLHLGLHLRVILPKKNLQTWMKVAFFIVFLVLAGAGLWLFIKNQMFDYMFFKAGFAFMDYEKSGFLVFVENILSIIFWVFAGYLISRLLTRMRKKAYE